MSSSDDSNGQIFPPIERWLPDAEPHPTRPNFVLQRWTVELEREPSADEVWTMAERLAAEDTAVERKQDSPQELILLEVSPHPQSIPALVHMNQHVRMLRAVDEVVRIVSVLGKPRERLLLLPRHPGPSRAQ